GDACEFRDQSAFAPFRRGDAVERQIGKEQDKHRLRLFACDLAVDVDRRLAELGEVAESAGGKSDVRRAGLAAELDRGIGHAAVAGCAQADVKIEGSEPCELCRAAHALWQSEQFGDDLQAVGIGGAQAKIYAPGWRRV